MLTGQRAYLKAFNANAHDEFGYSVALSADGTTLAVGAYGEDSSATGIGGDGTANDRTNAGAVYVFTRSGSAWMQQAYVKASNTNAHHAFGIAVALAADGSTLAVSAASERSRAVGVGGDQSDNSGTGNGAVYVFTRTGSTWSQEAYVKSSNTEDLDYFGVALALSADGATLAVGSAGESSNATGIGGTQTNNAAPGSGAVYMFTRANGTWSQQAYVKASNTQAHDAFGGVLALSGDGSTLAVAATEEDSGAGGVGGSQTDNSQSDAGAVYVFTRSNPTWSQQAYVKASNPDANDNFGKALALSFDGSTLAVGAPSEDSAATGIDGDQTNEASYDAGAAYVFTRSGSTWNQQAYVKASNTGSSHHFGSSVALTSTGTTLAVGAECEDGTSTGINGDQASRGAPCAGAAYLLARLPSWGHVAYVKASNPGRWDYYAAPGSLSLSGDGTILAVGARWEDSAGTSQADESAFDAGSVYLFD